MRSLPISGELKRANTNGGRLTNARISNGRYGVRLGIMSAGDSRFSVMYATTNAKPIFVPLPHT